MGNLGKTPEGAEGFSLDDPKGDESRSGAREPDNSTNPEVSGEDQNNPALPEPLTEAEKARRAEIRKKLEKTINEVLKTAGFKKDGSNWRRDVNDVVQIVNLQRSLWSFSYYLNVGVFRKQADLERLHEYIPSLDLSKYKPKVENCLPRNKTRLTGGREGLDKDSMNFEKAEDPNEMIEAIRQAISDVLVPLFLQYDEASKLAEGGFSRALADIYIEAQERKIQEL